ncbi:MAG: septation protein IspZ [Caulobacterales bacterium]|nr:septation protein IspZ [Caulobacterales bacterium]
MRNLMHAARPLLNDLFSSLLFAALIALNVDKEIATAAAIGLGVGHVVLWMALRKPIAPLQWASLALVLTFGTASLFLHDARFLMAKPTVIYLILTVMMLKRGWMLRYMPPVAIGHGEGPMVTFGYAWAGLMALTGAANLVIATRFPDVWPAFVAIFPMTSKIALFAVQFATVRHLTIRSVRAKRALSAAEAEAA